MLHLLIFCVPGKTNCHGSQGMFVNPGTIRLVRSNSRTTTSVGTLAQEKGTMQAVTIKQQPAVLVSAFTVVVGTEPINEVWLDLWQLSCPRTHPPRRRSKF